MLLAYVGAYTPEQGSPQLFMAQTALIIDTLKRALKLHGKTYADVAEYLQLSEASIKRMFAQHRFSLQRLDALR